jgi:hypothetical protein
MPGHAGASGLPVHHTFCRLNFRAVLVEIAISNLSQLKLPSEETNEKGITYF